MIPLMIAVRGTVDVGQFLLYCRLCSVVVRDGDTELRKVQDRWVTGVDALAGRQD
jgi:hypothetical protein